MVLTTKEASYIIVLGIVISVLPISSTAQISFGKKKEDRPRHGVDYRALTKATVEN